MQLELFSCKELEQIKKKRHILRLTPFERSIIHTPIIRCSVSVLQTIKNSSSPFCGFCKYYSRLSINTSYKLGLLPNNWILYQHGTSN